MARRLSSFWVYRGELGRHPREIVWLSVPSILGGTLGAWLMIVTDDKTFAVLVPYLILLATGLFIVQEPLARLRRRLSGTAAKGTVPIPPPSEQLADSTDAARESGQPPDGPTFARGATSLRWTVVLFSQFLVGVYGGYFGAGIGILMLAAYGILGFSNIHEANGIKNLNAMLINGIAGAMFCARGLVNWPQALVMAVGAIVGGYAGAGAARRLGQKNVRRLVIFIGLVLAVAMFFKRS